MSMFTLRLEDSVTKELNQICENQGYTKTGLIKSLIKDFLGKERVGKKRPSHAKNKRFADLCGVFQFGGNAVEDEDMIFELDDE